MATETTQQIVREAPEIEALKLQLMQQAQGLALSPALSTALQRPEAQYRIAGFDPTQAAAMQAAEQQGIGAFAPYLQTASQALQGAYGITGEAADILRGADVRNQFTDAQRALQQAGGATAAMTQGLPLLGQAQQMAGAAAGAPGFGQGIGAGYTAAEQARLAAQQPGFLQGEAAIYGGLGALGGAAQRFSPQATQEFMNPYQQQVIEESLRQINRQGDIARQGLAAQAVRSGAFGGTREGVQQAELERALSEQRNAAIVGGLQSGYSQAQQTAQQAFEAQQQRQLAQAQGYGGLAGQAGQLAAQQAGLGQQAAQQLGQAAALQAGTTGQQAGLQQQAANIYSQLAGQTANIYGQQGQQFQGLGQGIGALAGQQFGIGQQMAGGLGALGQQLGGLGIQAGALGQTAQGMSQADINFLYNIGQARQAQAQQVLDAQRASAMQQIYVPYQQAAFLSDIYRGAPSTQMATTAASTPQPSPFQQIAGTALGAAATAAAVKRAF
jgi:hypothetical protein